MFLGFRIIKKIKECTFSLLYNLQGCYKEKGVYSNYISLIIASFKIIIVLHQEWNKSVIWATWEAEIGRIMVRMPALANSLWDPHLQNNQTKMDWRCGLGGRGPTLQMQSPGFKPQFH
jgi:hypothetical protein